MLNLNDEITATFHCPVFKAATVITGVVVAIHDDLVCIKHPGTFSTRNTWLSRESVIKSGISKAR